MMGWSSRCYIPSFVKIGLPVLEKKIFEGFLPYIRAWRPFWSCDPDAINKLSFPLTREAPHKIFALIRQAVSKKKMFEIVNADGCRTDGRRSMGIL